MARALGRMEHSVAPERRWAAQAACRECGAISCGLKRASKAPRSIMRSQGGLIRQWKATIQVAGDSSGGTRESAGSQSTPLLPTTTRCTWTRCRCGGVRGRRGAEVWVLGLALRGHNAGRESPMVGAKCGGNSAPCAARGSTNENAHKRSGIRDPRGTGAERRPCLERRV